jgi:hypothetical protein
MTTTATAFLADTADDTMEGDVDESRAKRLVDRFLTWKLPATVCSDVCVTKRDYPHAHLRRGTNLLTADEARQMVKHLFDDEPVSPTPVGTNGIGWAVKQMHNGAKVRRAGWNGKGMFLFLVPGSTFKVIMKTAPDYVVPWLCSQADLLATDWEFAD